MVYSGWQVYMAERTSRCRLACEASVAVGLESKEWSRNGILDVLHARKILKPAFYPFDNSCTLYLVVSEMERANWQTFPIQKQYSLYGNRFTFTSTASRRSEAKEKRIERVQGWSSEGVEECRSAGVKEWRGAQAQKQASDGARERGARKRGSGKVRKRSEPRKSKGVNFAPHTYNVFDE